MNWRAWVYNRLRNEPAVTGILPAGVGGVHTVLESTPDERPFIVIRTGDTAPEIPGAESGQAVVWVHGYPTGYAAIDEVLVVVRQTLEGPVSEQGGIYARWQGDSPDLADDARGTFVRTSTYRLYGRREE